MDPRGYPRTVSGENLMSGQTMFERTLAASRFPGALFYSIPPFLVGFLAAFSEIIFQNIQAMNCEVIAHTA